MGKMVNMYEGNNELRQSSNKKMMNLIKFQ